MLDTNLQKQVDGLMKCAFTGGCLVTAQVKRVLSFISNTE